MLYCFKEIINMRKFEELYENNFLYETALLGIIIIIF